MSQPSLSRTPLQARLDDLIEKAERGSTAVLPFLSPHDARVAKRLIEARGLSGQAWFFGGYEGAERVCLFLLPDYMTAMLPCAPAEAPAEELQALLCEELAGAVVPLSVTGSGYRTLTHRDYLGAVLNLGLERDALGDIAVQNERRAILFCSRTVAAFLCTHLERVASDAVRCAPCTLDEGFTDGRSYRPISDTVASPRLDCVVAALTNLSREAAQSAIRTGLVEVEYEPEERSDAILTPPLVLTVRGHGKYILRAFEGETRKGRLRLRADQLV